MEVKVCSWKACSWKFSKYIMTRLKNDKEFYDMKKLKVSESPCMGECKKWANIKIKNQAYNYANPAKASEIIKKEYK